MSADKQALYREAQRLIRLGQPVFPCVATGEKAKRPTIKGGFTAASTDRDTIKRWLRQDDRALAIPTGVVWDVLDVDVKNDSDGRVHLPYLQRLGLLNGCQRIVRTPSGGWHLYFKVGTVSGNHSRGDLGLDVRGKGGYVLIPPSYIETDEYDGFYEDMGAVEDNDDSPLMWENILTALAPVDTETKKPIELLPSERRASMAALREWLSNRQKGERNNALHWAVCRAIENGIDPRELEDVALLIGLTEEEISLTISSAMKRAGVTPSDLKSSVEVMFS